MSDPAAPITRFRRGVAALSGGTLASQLVTMAALPMLARLLTPAQFGTAAVFGLLAGMVSVTATGRYALAVVLPRSERLATAVARSSLLATAIVVLLTGVTVVLGADALALALGDSGVASWLLLVPLAVAAAGVFELLTYQCTRERRFAALGGARAFQGIGGTALTLALAVGGLGAGALILGPLTSQLVATLGLAIWVWRPAHLARSRPGDLARAVRLYRRFPAFDLPNALAHTASRSGTVLLLGVLFGPEPVGVLMLAERLMIAPFSALAGALSTTNYPELAAAHRADPGLFAARVESGVSAAGRWFVPIFALGALAAPWVVVPLLGARWAGLEDYVAILAPPLCLGLVMAPVSYALKVVNRPDVSFYLNLLLMLAKASAAIVAARVLGLGPIPSLWCFSAAWFAVLALNLHVVLGYAGVRRRRLVLVALLLGCVAYGLAPGSPLIAALRGPA